MTRSRKFDVLTFTQYDLLFFHMSAGIFVSIYCHLHIVQPLRFFFLDIFAMSSHAYGTKYNPKDAQVKTWSVMRTLDPLVAQVGVVCQYPVTTLVSNVFIEKIIEVFLAWVFSRVFFRILIE